MAAVGLAAKDMPLTLPALWASLSAGPDNPAPEAEWRTRKNSNFHGLGDNNERGAEGASGSARRDVRKERPRAAAKRKSTAGGKTTAKSKKNHLAVLLSKPNGARIPLIVERLG
ncbi:hypothetical protein [uncultured Hoeflea sp.]|uniref:hypothetical protein n=1 Tax=uncultured Hoeflea sp. TaxID=538666 RepID=UPI00261D2B8F|nr:hypothetical protein [uncultured Hoeflea sp.]